MNKWLTVIGIAGFISIVVYLHLIQSDYHPLYQLMSELALGKQGELMLVAFFSFALAVISASLALSNKLLKILLYLAALALAGAGIFKLGAYTVLHVALVAIAFVLIVLTMYPTPKLSNTSKTHTLMSWTLAALTALFVALGETLIPIGLAQRLAALTIFCWLAGL